MNKAKADIIFGIKKFLKDVKILALLYLECSLYRHTDRQNILFHNFLPSWESKSGNKGKCLIVPGPIPFEV